MRKHKALYYLAGMLVLVLGISLVLLWWKDVVVLFRGGIGVVLALAGMLLLFLASE